MNDKRIKRKEWIHYLPPVVLRNLIKGFPKYGLPHCCKYMYGPGEILAYTLYMAGAKTFNFTHSWLSGDDSRPEHLMVHSNSVTVTPYIKCPLPEHKDRPLLWYLMDKSPWGMCGGAAGQDTNYMQVGTKHCKDAYLDAELHKAVSVFQHYIQHFPR